jgi:hypothetical protein
VSESSAIKWVQRFERNGLHHRANDLAQTIRTANAGTETRPEQEASKSRTMSIQLALSRQTSRKLAFFTRQEAQTLEAAMGRILPADELGPGAVEAGGLY